MKYENNIKELYANRKKGVSMAVMLCVSAFFIAFASAIIYTAGLLTAQSTRRLKEERCYQLANSYAQILDTQLTKYTNKTDETIPSDSFYKFASNFLDSERYAEYNSSYPDQTQYHYIISSTQLNDVTSANDSDLTNYGNIVLTLKKEADENEQSVASLTSGTIPVESSGSDYTAKIDSLKNVTVRPYVFTVEVKAYYDDATYAYSTEYTREEKYNVQFTHNGNTIVWDAATKKWRLNNTGGEEYDPSASSTGTGENVIAYKYITSETTESRFIPSVE